MNLEYRLPNGQKVKFLDDQKTYLGNQLESEFGSERCFGIVANMDFIMICTYEKDGADPELRKKGFSPFSLKSAVPHLSR